MEALRFKQYELLLDSNLRHSDCDYRSILPAGWSRSDAVHLIHAVDDLTEGSVLTIEVGSICMHDDELGTSGVRIHRTRHGNHTTLVLKIVLHTVGRELTLDVPARTVPLWS